ncbi:MAG: cytochrome c maturation protein CcmE [Candidatus Binataceae bacterium]
MRIKVRFLIAGGLIVGAIAFLIFTAVRNTAEYYLTVPEVKARQAELGDQALRVAGRVKPGGILWDPATLTLAFTIGPLPPEPKDGNAAAVTPVANAADPVEFHVVCKGQPKPDMFAEGRDVIVEGRLVSSGEIAATQVLTSCPSKYAPKK